jgi:hypothetical protein
MKKFWTKVLFVAAGILSFIGIQPSWAAPTPTAPQVGQVKETTPLYLKLGSDRVTGSETDTSLAGWRHYQHYAHYAHRSHWAHYAHYAHNSHYNMYR